MKPKIDAIVNIATLIACGAVVASLFEGRVAARRPHSSTFHVGERLPEIEGLDFRKAQQTLLLVVASNCRFCVESMPFYRKLITAVTARHRMHSNADASTGLRDAQIVGLSTDESEVLRSYFDRHDVDPETLVSMPRGLLKLEGTPTLILADSSGVIKDVWLGRLDARGEADVSAKLLGE